MNHVSSCILSSLFLLGLTIFVRFAGTTLTLSADRRQRRRGKVKVCCRCFIREHIKSPAIGIRRRRSQRQLLRMTQSNRVVLQGFMYDFISSFVFRYQQDKTREELRLHVC
jgi:hypothetical protein